MSNKTINQFTEDTSPTVDDFVPTWDVTTGTTKKVSILNLLLKILTGGTSWAWSSWTPSFTNITQGNGTVVAKYTQIGKTVFVRITLVFGTTTVMGTGPIMSLPVAAKADYGVSDILGQVHSEDTGNFIYDGFALLNTVNNAVFFTKDPASYVRNTGINATVPFVWGTGDKLHILFTYEAA